MQDFDLIDIAAFKLSEAGKKLKVLAENATSDAARSALLRLAEQIAKQEDDLRALAAKLPRTSPARAG